jgi:PAS domain S-box-containing protein
MPATLTPEALLDAISSAAVIVDEGGTIIGANRAWQRFSRENGGDARTFYVGRNYLDICRSAGSESSAEASVVAAGLLAVLGGDEEFRCEYPCHSATEFRWFEVAIAPLVLADRRLGLVMHHNITKRRRQQDEVRRSQTESNALAALVANSADAIISFDHDGIIQTWNAAAADLYGFPAEEVIGRPIEILYPDGSVPFSRVRDGIIAGDLHRFEVVRRTRSGELRDIAVSAATVRDADGAVVSMLGIHRDITEEKATREHLAFITRELSHRTKNLLAIILAIERQTARSAESLDAFHGSFAARLRSLEASLDLLVARRWERVSMAELARSQLSVFVDPDDGRLAVGGPDVTLDTQAVEAVGMSLHELATNAMKHGALGPAGGAIRLNWTTDPSAAGAVLAIRWDERSPAIAGPPEQTGFGHLVLTRLIERKLGAEVGIEFGPGRLSWGAVLPQAHFTTGG